MLTRTPQLLHRSFACPHELPHGFIPRGGNPNGGEFPGTVQLGQGEGIATVCLHPLARRIPRDGPPLCNEHTVCQIGVFAAYVSRHGHAFIDRALYLPKTWTDNPVRMAAARVPDDTIFATKPALAVGMIERAIAAG